MASYRDLGLPDYRGTCVACFLIAQPNDERSKTYVRLLQKYISSGMLYLVTPEDLSLKKSFPSIFCLKISWWENFSDVVVLDGVRTLSKYSFTTDDWETEMLFVESKLTQIYELYQESMCPKRFISYAITKWNRNIREAIEE